MTDKAEETTPCIVHVIPYDGIGGVETAAATVSAGPHAGFTFRKAYVASKHPAPPRAYVWEPGIGPENNPIAFARTIRHLLRLRPDVLVLSLWRACIVGLVVKVLRPRTRLVLFLHNIHNSNWIDAALTRMTARRAAAIWADSASTASLRLGEAFKGRARPISFLTTRIERVAEPAPAPTFITWGRLHPRKRIELAIEFFACIHARHPQARFDIIGPDRGEQAMLEGRVAALNLQDAVRFLGPADLGAITDHAARSAFFIQTSRAEGMGMAVIEAMQFGLVPIVTPVGEIGRYVEDGANGIWFSTPADTCTRVDALLTDPAAFRAVSDAAARTWTDRPLYRDEFLAACGELARALGSPRP
ncbi:glycosyltransferase family 4 protein [Sphingomonas jatrophae]|uniref:Glycosyltransferase involved in cell wall bisynthesis n=1 Tax=Sphingomonas jatrophae TaxID=1166337 RepID=A0A1I6L698_9SPHN|nr:glycosyltransferase family 4 protein [Sphingomonas jatrophae]SFR99003.1 Glycosyltransferase involved in cell wall bisynthesis [Sphingomonas jatrophae]